MRFLAVQDIHPEHDLKMRWNFHLAMHMEQLTALLPQTETAEP
jgi:hypothetical protein